MDAVNDSIKSSDQLFDKLIKMTPDKVARVYAGGDNFEFYGFEFEKSILSQGFRNMTILKLLKKWVKVC